MLSLVESAAKKEDERANKKLAKKVYSESIRLLEALLILDERNRHMLQKSSRKRMPKKIRRQRKRRPN